ncbi:MAG: 30S ribosomal protein S8 [Armatimonadetes bacterium]|nr:30S ribosomal protein S8 [Armatimonadota bacterium]MDW8121173.1 30S ribosomal protein S8 [Armatimonadota bacterium]
MPFLADPLGDTLTRIRNAYGARHEEVIMPASQWRVSLAQVLKREGYISDYWVVKESDLQKGRAIVHQALEKRLIPSVAFRNPELDWVETLKRKGLNISREAEKELRIIRQLFAAKILKHPKRWGPLKSGVLFIRLKYLEGFPPRPAITGIQQVSRPSRRLYAGRRKLPRVRAGLGIAIVSTHLGVMSDSEARRKGVGGQILAYIW